MKNVYAPLLLGQSHIPLLYPNLGTEERESILFLNRAFRWLTEPLVTLVDDPAEADAILIPHNFSSIRTQKAYLNEQAQLAMKHGKKLLVFWHGDSDAPVDLPNVTVFRTSQYGYKKRDNEVMMPAYAEDLLEGECSLRAYHDGAPLVGFCGWANYKNLKNRLGTLIKDGLIDTQVLFGQTHKQVHHKGISIRMRAIKWLQQSPDVQSNFIIRSSYSGHRQTISVNPEQARQEYIDNLHGSDLALVIKGDGNYSYRFYEALSLGRLPLLIDTDCVLPLGDTIQYDDIVLRVPYENMFETGRLVAEWWAHLTPEEFTAKQQRARQVFEQSLRIDADLRYVVERYF